MTENYQPPPGEARFCSRPFEHLEINSKGDVFACCPGWLPKVIGNIFRHSLMDIWNSPAAQEIRESILDGSYRHCIAQYCPHLVKNDLPSASAVRDPEYRRIIDAGSTVMDRGPRVVDPGFDNTCNLSCPTCRTSVIYNKLNDMPEGKTVLENLLAGNTFDEVRQIVVTGHGDPFASPMLRRLLTEKLSTERYPRLKVKLYTNGIMFDEKAWAAMHRIHDSINEIHISIDAATAGTYHVVRRGGRWDKLQQGLALASRLRTERQFEFKISFVMQRRNYREAPAFVLMGQALGADVVTFQSVKNWGRNTFTPEEFERDVEIHNPRNPDHIDFLRVMADPIFLTKKPLVYLGALEPFTREQANAQTSVAVA